MSEAEIDQGQVPGRAASQRSSAEGRESAGLTELVQRGVDAWNAGDFDAVMDLSAPDAVWQPAGAGLDHGERFEGAEAIRAFYEMWREMLEDLEIEIEESRDLGHGVTFSRFVQRAKPRGSTGSVEFHYASVELWADERVQRTWGYTNADEGRAAAERLAAERAGEPAFVPGETEARVRAIYGRFDLENFHPECEWRTRTDLPDSGTYHGHEEIARMVAEWEVAFDDLVLEPVEIREVAGKVLVLVHTQARIKGSGEVVEMDEVHVLRMRDGKLIEIREYLTKEEALRSLGGAV
jgi:ketosteroid isomerase-like protein